MQDAQYYGLWKIALLHMFKSEYISDHELIDLHKNNLFLKENMTHRERDILFKALSVMDDVDGIKELLSIEANFISKGELPQKKLFESHLIGYLAECLCESCITEFELFEMMSEFDYSFDIYSEKEKYYIDIILEMVRLNLVSKNPSAIQFIDNPSFELLMFVNGVEQ